MPVSVESLMTAISSGRCNTYDIELIFVSTPELVTALNNVSSVSGLTPLCLACKMNRYDIVHLLLNKGASANVSSTPICFRKAPLHYATDHSGGNLDIVRILLEAGAEPNVQDVEKVTPLHLACTESNVPVVQALLRAGADVSVSDVDDETPLVRACYAKSVELVDLLLKEGSDPDEPFGRPLEIVVRAPSLESLKLLIEAGADISRNTYLSFASEHNYLDMMKVLHNYGADVNRTGNLGLTALHHACRSMEATMDAVRLLLKWEANPNTPTSTGDTPLHFACQMFALDKVRTLLTYGAEVNTLDGTLTSPLVCALTTRPPHQPGESPDNERYMSMIRLLLAAGSKLSFATLERIKVLIVFVQNSASHKEELLQLLAQHTSEPPSLQLQCRTKIRDVFRHRGNIDEKTALLPVPKAVMSFLQFSEVPGCTYSPA